MKVIDEFINLMYPKYKSKTFVTKNDKTEENVLLK